MNCIFCGHGLDRVDRHGVGHLVLDSGFYREVPNDESDLRCGYCGGPLTGSQKTYFDQRCLKEVVSEAGN